MFIQVVHVKYLRVHSLHGIILPSLLAFLPNSMMIQVRAKEELHYSRLKHRFDTVTVLFRYLTPFEHRF